MISAVLNKIFNEYPTAKSEAFTAHPLANYVWTEANQALAEILDERYKSLIIDTGVGAGNWATVPWMAVFDPLITRSARRGYYVVFLFHSNKPIVHLSLNQGATAVEDEFGRTKLSLQILTERAGIMRARLNDYEKYFKVKKIELGSDQFLPRAYEAGHVLGTTYYQDNMPYEVDIARDLNRLIEGYLTLTFRGGIEPSIESKTGDEEVFIQGPLVETRRYRMHKKIERNGAASKAAKKFHGYRCQACDLEFTEQYGEIGKDYIEAHHLKPISDLEEGKAVEYDVKKDFAVLCANCHRMIHRSNDPGNLDAFKELLKKSL